MKAQRLRFTFIAFFFFFFFHVKPQFLLGNCRSRSRRKVIDRHTLINLTKLPLRKQQPRSNVARQEEVGHKFIMRNLNGIQRSRQQFE